MKFFAVIGNPIVHSKSPRMHNYAISKLQESGIYTRICLEDKTRLRFNLCLIDGANITVPFKEEAVKIADFKSDEVLKIGSANTLLIKSGKIHAYNTDYLGFLKAIEEFKDIKSALILGAGGTSKALAYALKTKNIDFVIANRSKNRFNEFNDCKCFLYEELDLNKKFDLIINASSAGLDNDNLACNEEILKSIFKHASYAFDVIYGKETPFLKLAKEFCLQIKDGEEMLIWQGVYAFEIFFDNHNIDEIYKAMKIALQLH